MTRSGRQARGNVTFTSGDGEGLHDRTLPLSFRLANETPSLAWAAGVISSRTEARAAAASRRGEACGGV